MENLELKEFFEDLRFLCAEGLLALRCEETNNTDNLREKFNNIVKLVQEKEEAHREG